MNLRSDIHETLSRRVLLPAGRLRRLAHPARRQAATAYSEGMAQRRALHSFDAAARREWILNRLRSVVRRAAAETTYYRELFQRVGFEPLSEFSFDDFAHLPVLE